jgi:hypothetical protein
MTIRQASGLAPLLLSLVTSLVVFTPLPVSPAWAAATPGNLPSEIVTYFTPEDVARGWAYATGRYWLFAAGTGCAWRLSCSS